MEFIKGFQEKHGLVGDGIIGHNTLHKIKEVYCIDTNEQVAHLVGQCDHESAGFTRLIENLNYSASALLRVWPRHFNSDNVNIYARNPEKIANRAYANRMGNSDEASGDGWNYRGRGVIQLTGKNNYSAFGKDQEIDLLSNPDLVLDYFFEPAVFYFGRANIWRMAKNMEDAAIAAVTKKINGGYHGLDERTRLTYKYFEKL